MTPVNKKSNKLTIVFDLVRFEILVWFYIFFSFIRSGYVHSLLVLITSLYGSLNIYDLLHAMSIYLYILYKMRNTTIPYCWPTYFIDWHVSQMVFGRGLTLKNCYLKNVAPESDKGCVKRYRLLSWHYFNGQCGKSILIFQWKL